jgi:AraC-like DNA-binding protein
MVFRQFRPSPPLDRFIEFFWYWKGDALPYRKELIMASPTMGLLVNLHEDVLRHYDGNDFDVEHRSRGIAISGVSTEHFAIDAVQPEIMGLQFRPGGAYPFFAPSARLFRDRHVALEDVWGVAAAARLHHRLVEAPTIAAKVCLLQTAMLERMPRELAQHPAVALALCRFRQRPEATRVGAVAVETGLSRRRFIEVFTDEVGFAPKLYLRLARFQRVLHDVFDTPVVDWSEIAYRYGYADQPHFNREFREFAGLTPTQYHARPGMGAKHAQLVDHGR